ncbi:Hpt domain-containing protein [Zhouia sp. PK063]|uniref:Hpt domain-containing protein n=1 Tax=Zhouia sp. PK063 TaxID=3373602 RepID=UPI0037A78BAD
MTDFKIAKINLSEKENALLTPILTSYSPIATFSNTFEALQAIKSEPTLFWFLVVPQNALPLNAMQLSDYLSDHHIIHFAFIIGAAPQDQNPALRHIAYIEAPFQEAFILKTIRQITEQDSTATAEKTYALNYLKEVSDNDEAFIIKSLTMFIDSVSERILKIEDLLPHADAAALTEIREIAHSIKPSFDMVENIKGKNICHTICYEAKDEEINNYVVDLRLTYDGIKKAIHHDWPQI